MELLAEDSDSLAVTDIKTSRGKWSAEQIEDSGEQLPLYLHLASEIAPGKKITTRFLVLAKTKEPVVEEACPEGRTSRRETHLGGRGACLAGDREWRVLYGAEHYELRVVWLSGGVSGLDRLRRKRHGKSCAAFS